MQLIIKVNYLESLANLPIDDIFPNSMLESQSEQYDGVRLCYNVTFSDIDDLTFGMLSDFEAFVGCNVNYDNDYNKIVINLTTDY